LEVILCPHRLGQRFGPPKMPPPALPLPVSRDDRFCFFPLFERRRKPMSISLDFSFPPFLCPIPLVPAYKFSFFFFSSSLESSGARQGTTFPSAVCADLNAFRCHIYRGTFMKQPSPPHPTGRSFFCGSACLCSVLPSFLLTSFTKYDAKSFPS